MAITTLSPAAAPANTRAAVQRFLDAVERELDTLIMDTCLITLLMIDLAMAAALVLS